MTKAIELILCVPCVASSEDIKHIRNNGLARDSIKKDMPRLRESVRLSWTTRFVSRFGRALQILTCRGRSRTSTQSKSRRKVTPVMSVVHKGPQSYSFRRRQPKETDHERSQKSGRTGFVSVYDPDNNENCKRSDDGTASSTYSQRIPTPPAIRTWTTQEINGIFRGNDQLRNYFVFQKQLGSGSFSVVCKATHKVTRETVAIKIIAKKDLQLRNDVHRIDREMENMSSIDHPHVIKVFQTIHTPEMAFLIMEYCSGGDLFDRIVSQRRIEEEEARNIFRQILSAVIHLHKLSIHHRDLKPENILLESHDNSTFVKLIDFNLSTHLTNTQSLCSTPCGTVDYAAPEIFKCVEYNPLYSESWTLGILLYTLLASEFPFTNQNRHEEMKNESYPLPGHLSSSARELISKILRFDPEKRLTPTEMLAHPWLKESNKNDHSLKINPKSSAKTGSGEEENLPIATRESLLSSLGTDDVILLDEEVVRITGDLMNKGGSEVRKVIEESDRTSPIFCTYSIVSRKKRLLEFGEFTSWLNRIQKRGTSRRSRRNLRFQRKEIFSDLTDLRLH